MVDDELRDAGLELRTAAERRPAPEPRSFRRPAQTGRRVAATMLVVVLGGALLVWTDRVDELDVVSTDGMEPPVVTTVPSQPHDTDPPDPATFLSPWQTQFDAGPLALRAGHSVVWTGSEMIVWGGSVTGESSSILFDDGASFDPATDEWRLLPRSPLTPTVDHVAYWSGSEMVVVGGYVGGDSSGGRTSPGVPSRAAAAYDPSTDLWRALPDAPLDIDRRMGWAVAGSRLVAWAVDIDEQLNRMVELDAGADRWTEMGAPPVEDAVTGAIHIVDGELVAVWANLAAMYSAAVLDPGSGSWALARSARTGFDLQLFSVVTAGEVMVWSNSGAEGPTMRFDPRSMSWTEAPRMPVQPCDGAPQPLAVGDDVIAFAWCSPSAVLDADAGTWTGLAWGGIAGGPRFGDGRHVVWTGTEVLAWGDQCCDGEPIGERTMFAWRLAGRPWRASD